MEALAAAPLVDADVVADGLVELRRLIERQEAEFCRRVGAWEELDRGRGGAGDSLTMLRARTRMGAADVRRRQDVARELTLLPEARAAFAEGEITLSHAASLARCVAENGIASVAPRSEALLEAARREDADRLREATRQVRHMVSPEGALRDAEEDHRRRWFSVSAMENGRFRVEGVLTGEDGSLLRTAVEAFSAIGQNDFRSPSQRRADGLVELARQVLEGGRTRRVNGVKPHLTMTVSAETLRRTPGAPGASLRWGAVVPAETARRLACDASITEVGLTAEGDPLAYGRTRRTIPPALRRLVILRDRHCRFPGCDMPPEWCDVHHIVHWMDGGETTLANSGLLCRRHHRMLHEGGRTWAEAILSAPSPPLPEPQQAPPRVGAGTAASTAARGEPALSGTPGGP